MRTRRLRKIRISQSASGQPKSEDQGSIHALCAFCPFLTARPLRAHQRRLFGLVQGMACGQTNARDILATVTPGGGKLLLPVLAGHVLVGASLVERVCWVVPHDSLRLQADEAFADPI